MRLRPDRRRGAAIAGALALTLMVLAGCSVDAPDAGDNDAQADVALPEETVTRLEEAVTGAMTASGSSGAIVGVWAPWSGTWVAAYGTQGVDGEPVTTDMTFPAARITRAMTCDVLYQLAEKGTVDLDDSVTEYVAGVPALTDVTLDQLCQSTSGIGSYSGKLLPMWVGNPEREWNPRELAGHGLGAGLSGTPGTAFRDSDAGYLLLGLALERAAQRSAAELFEEYVTDPLGLEATGLEQSPSSAERLVGTFASKIDGGRDCAAPLDMTAASLSVGFTDSGAVTDIEDLGTYVQALAAQTLMPEGTDRYDAPLAVSPDQPSWYTTAGGAIIAGDLVGHFGVTPGYTTVAFSDPETGLTVAAVLNDSAGGQVFGAYLGWQLAAIASKAPAAAGHTAPESGVPWTAEEYQSGIAERAICAPVE